MPLNGVKHDPSINNRRVGLDMGCRVYGALRHLSDSRRPDCDGDRLTDYYIIRTRQGKEQVVEAAIQRLGFTAWCPLEVRPYRTAAMRKIGQTAAKEHPAMPKTILAAIPVHEQGRLHYIRDFVRVDCDAACTPLRVPASHIEAFFETLEAWNEAERRRITRGNRGRPQKKKWVKLEPQTLGAVLEEMFGTVKQEMAA